MLESAVDIEAQTVTVLVGHFTLFAILGVQTPPPKLPAEFSLCNLSIDPVEVEVGESVEISVDINNIGKVEGSYLATLNINGEVEAIKEITLQGGETKTVAFSVARESPATYTAEVGGLIGSFRVTKPINAWLIGGIINTMMLILGLIAVIILGMTVLLLRRRRGWVRLR